MAERAFATIKAPEARQTCSNSCKQKSSFNSSGSSADRILQLQRTAGNQVVQRLIKERKFWLSVGYQPNYEPPDKSKRAPMVSAMGYQEADAILWTVEALFSRAEKMRDFLTSKFGDDKDLRVTSVVKEGEHTTYRKMDVVPAGKTTYEELAAAAVHAGFWVHAEGVYLGGKFWPLSPKATGAHLDLYLLRSASGDFPIPQEDSSSKAV